MSLPHVIVSNTKWEIKFEDEWPKNEKYFIWNRICYCSETQSIFVELSLMCAIILYDYIFWIITKMSAKTHGGAPSYKL